ncbi:parasitic phase-specific protein PSP-1 [Corynespora cassiicola Philippines]|uniref:Parasitic phase-specific protein PSP-1 n=1 Tax=Corynespora cassiicola Philippines TaxID=1448308 RepID=A0A2T2NPR8_CORCC|nr:parasitic phase-specific protein PSP-1 [Corynespora cassiicola Philippines]
MTGKLPDGLIAFGPDANCTLDTCPLEWSIFRYKPSIPANGLFIGIFGLLLAVHALQGWWYKKWAYMACMVAGCILQIVGYVGRLLLHGNPFDFDAFLIQIICITVAPVFYCAAVYVLLTQVILLVDKSLSRFDPRYFYWFFIPADIVSLVLQATGGALSAVGDTAEDVQVGVDISKAGLIFQVVVLTFFLILFADYLIRCWQKDASLLSGKMRFFLSFMFLAVSFILLRCVYRIIELKDGYFGPSFRNEPNFIALESSVMCVAVLCLNIGHPGRALCTESDSTKTASISLGRTNSLKSERDGSL